MCTFAAISYYWSGLWRMCMVEFFVCPETLLLKNSDQLSDYRKKNFYNGNAATDAIYSLSIYSPPEKFVREAAYGQYKKGYLQEFCLILHGFMCWNISKKIRAGSNIFIKCFHLLSTYLPTHPR